MGDFWKRLISPDEAAVDSIIFNGSIAMVALFIFSGYQVIQAPASFNISSFGIATAAILGAIGAGKRMRDGPTNVSN